jgi:PhzF family phenazine biosynthesis protein
VRTPRALPSSAARVLRYAAFTYRGRGGNPAGLLLDAADLDDGDRLAVAAQVGYSETAFVDAQNGQGQYTMRIFSVLAEVAFCGPHFAGSTATSTALSRPRGVWRQRAPRPGGA